MRLVQLRCYNCGTQAEFPLSDFEERKLAELGFLARSCKGCGSTTRWDPVEPGTHGHVDVAEPSPVRRRIILIDDDENILTVFGKALKQKGFDVETALSARDALTRLARGRYDVILSDIRMPGFDGKQLFAFLDEHLPADRDRVAFLTGDIANPETSEFLQQTKVPYLVKPFSLPALLDLIDQVLGVSRPARETQESKSESQSAPRGKSGSRKKKPRKKKASGSSK